MKYIFCILLCLTSISVFANPPIFTDSIEDAEKISKDFNMPVITIVSADWCHYCLRLEKNISDNLNVFDNYIILKLDFDEHKSFVTQNKIKKIPTLIYKNKKYVGIYDIESLKQILK